MNSTATGILAAGRGAPRILPSILTRAGHYFNFLQPERSEILIEDIAHALAHTCRFGGHTREFYSVAQHCVLASHVVPEADAFAALMHDAAEAYVGDIPTPLKQLLPEFKAIEKRVEQAVLNRFCLALPLPESVKHADLVMLATERRDLMPPDDAEEWDLIRNVEPMERAIRPWTPEQAYNAFVTRFNQVAPVALRQVFEPRRLAS